MDHLTFTQQFLMAMAHGGPPCIVAYLTYRSLKARQERHAKDVIVRLNGGLEEKIASAVKKALDLRQ